MNHLHVASPPPLTDAHLPRLLCLHGGGVNAAVFRRQCRTFTRLLSPHFRLVFADGPYDSVAGPDVLSVYAAYGPFKRWLRWRPEHPAVNDHDAVLAIETCMTRAMEADNAEGAQGQWVGLLGFSQGAKIAASVLFETQLRNDKARRLREFGGADTHDEGFAGGDWRFAVLLAGRAPLVALSDFERACNILDRPGEMRDPPDMGQRAANRLRLRMPTVHVHGLRDPGIGYHRAMWKDFTTSEVANVVEWDGDHRVPIKTKDVERIVQATLKAAMVWYSSLHGVDFGHED